MVGSRNYFDEEIDGNFNVSTAPNRQPGSAFKPFVYAEALRNGYTPDTVVFDLQTQFSTECRADEFETEKEECYTPSNYDDVFRGPVTLRNALAQSINIPSIKVLYLAGLQNSLRLAQNMGIKSLVDVNRYGLTLVLGGGEVSLLDMTSAYGVFANEGERNEPTPILRIENSDGNIIEEINVNPRRVLEEQVALQISDIISDNDARAPAFGQRSYLYFPGRDVASKTGTTNEYRDAWIVGYTPQLSVGAWAGNNDNTPMEKKVAGFIIAPLWNEFMQEVLARDDQVPFKEPFTEDEFSLKPILKGLWQGGKEYVVDSISGKLATDMTPVELRESRVVTDVHSILYWIDKRNPRGDPLKNPSKDSQFELWEYGVQKWRAEQNIETGSEDSIPTAYDNIHTEANKPRLTITRPNATETYDRYGTVSVLLNNKSKFALTKVNFFVNGTFVGSSTKAPFNFSFVPSDVGVKSGSNKLTAVGYDAVLNEGEISISFNVR